MSGQSRFAVLSGRFAALALIILGIVHWSELLSPPIEHLVGYDVRKLASSGHPASSVHVDGISLGSLVSRLARFKSDIYPPEAGPFDGPLFLLLSLVAALGPYWLIRGAFRYWDESFRPLTILDASFRLDFLDNKMSSARFSRVQLLLANRAGITAYQARTTVDQPQASIVRSSIRYTSIVGGRNITKPDLDISGKDANVEVTEQYTRDLPHSFFVSLIPHKLTLLLYSQGFFDKYVVRRSGDVVYNNQHNELDAYLSISSQHPTSVARLVISFPEVSAPHERDIRFRLVSNLVSSDLGFEMWFEGDRQLYQVKVRGFNANTIKVTWKNLRLKQYLDAATVD